MRARPDRYVSLLVSIALTVAIVAPSGVASASGASGTGRFPASRRAAVASDDTEHKGSRFPVKGRTFGTSGTSAPSVADVGLPGAAAETTILVDPLAPSVPGELVVALDSVLFAASSERALEARGATVEKLEGDSAALLVKTPAGMSDPVFTQVAEDTPGVAWVQPNYIYRATYTPSDPLYGSGSSGQWGLRRIEAPAAWDVTKGDDGVLVAVVDTGVDYTHPDLASGVDTSNDWDFINGDSDAMDDHGHGTHVSGVIAASMDNGVGGVGVAPQARILPVKVLDSKGSGDTFGVSAGIRYAADSGARIINLSLAGPSDASMASAVAYAQSRGCVVVAATGNDGSSGGASYPARYTDVVGVGATTSGNTHAAFSNYGDGVDISAPGVNILSTLPTAIYPSGYGSWNGTSMATPFVSGVAALVMSVDPGMSSDAVIQRVLSTAQDLGDPGVDNVFGHGLVRADLAVEGPVAIPDDSIPGVPLVSSPVTGTLDVATDRDDVYSIYLSAGQTLEASMTGSPYPGTDFDLYLYPPNTAGLEDTHSIVGYSFRADYPESIAYTAPVGGEYYLDVSAYEGAGSYTVEWARGGVSDDNIPGVALPPSPVNGSLDTTTDEFDVYHVDLAAGEQLTVYMAGPPSPADYDLLLYGPGSTSIYTDTPLATRESTLSVETMRYVSKTGGTYYLAVRAWLGSGPYQMEWVVDPYSPDDNIPGIAMPPSSFESTVGGLADDDDVYKVFLQAGQTLDVTVTTEPQPFPYYPYLFLYPPTATDVEIDVDSILEGWSAEASGLNYFSHVATSTGYFYVDLYSLGDPVGYTLEWSTSSDADNNIPGAPAPTSPITGELGVSTDTDDVYRIHAHAGQWISVSLTGEPALPATTTDFDLYLFPPGSTSTTDTPLALSDGEHYPKPVGVKAPTTGDYYLQAHAFAGEGTYSLSWSVKSFATVYKPVGPSRVTHGHHFTVYGYVAPRHTSGTYLVTLKFYKRDSHGTYVYHNSVKARRYYYSTTKTKYRASVSLPHKGAWRVRAMHSDSGLPDVYSVYDYITVR